MSVKPTSTFGNRFNVRDVIGTKSEDAPTKSAEFYANIGYIQDDAKYPFLSIGGTALDGPPRDTGRINDPAYARFLKLQAAKREAWLSRASQLQPGEAVIVALDEETGIAVELRRVGKGIDVDNVDLGEEELTVSFRA